MSDHSLVVNNLIKSYKNNRVLDNISLSIRQGDIIGLLGPNGSGKTTSFYMIAGLMPCDHGSIQMNGIDITKLTITQRAKLGLSYLPQEASVFRKLSVADNIMAILELRQDYSKAEQTLKLAQLLQAFNIEHLSQVLGIQLSGGERRRVELARCMAGAPQYILLDEPFAGIDPIAIADIKKIIIQLKAQGIGILITDHNVKATLDICDSAYILHSGHIICRGDAQTILQDSAARQVYLGEDFRL